MDKFQKLRKTLGENLKLAEPMSNHTTLKIGGAARFFIEASSERELFKALEASRRLGIEALIIGEGSNLLVNEKGFDGLIIKNKICGISSSGTKLSIKSGTLLQEVVDKTIKLGLAGMEKMTGIPGTLGAAIYGNAGAYGQTISDCLIRVKVYNGKRVKWLSKKECRFAYRESVFKNNKWTILEAEFFFTLGNSDQLKVMAEGILKLRHQKYPPNLLCPGSLFKNILVSEITPKQLSKIPPDKIVYEKIPAGYLLEAVGAKGARLGKIKVADYHANLFTNDGGGTASDFYKLAVKYQKKVKRKFGIKLIPEVQLIGFSKPL